MEKKFDVTIHMVGHGHIDPVWLWRWTEGYEEVRATFRSALDRMNETPDFNFTSSSACFYAWIKACDPAMFDEIRARVKEGRWEIAGGWWVEPDCNIPSGESFVRHGLYAQRFFEKEFGVSAKVGFNPDSFGHAGTLPQILAKQGIDYYVYMRPNAAQGEMEYPEGTTFLWKATDGSRVLACNLQFAYCSGTGMPECVEALPVNPHFNPDQAHILGFFGVGNHGGGPTKLAIKEILEWNKACKKPRVCFSTLYDYFQSFRDSMGVRSVPEIESGLQHHARGCYSVHSEIKRLNRRAEHALMTAERFATAAWLLKRRPYPGELLERAWKKVLFNQFHDILGGTCIEAAYEDARDEFGTALNTAREVLNESVQAIARHVDTTPEGNTVFAVNPLPWPAKQTVTVSPTVQRTLQHPLCVVDSDGTPIDCQVVEGPYPGSTAYAITAEVPPLGYHCYHFRSGSNPLQSRRMLKTGDLSIENDWWKIEFDSHDGCISGLFDKTSRVDVLKRGNVLSVLADPSDTWSHGVAQYGDEIGRFGKAVLELAESGPVRATMRIFSTYGASAVEQLVTLHREIPTLDIVFRINWQQRYAALKLVYDTRIESGSAVCDTAYGYETRPTDGSEQPCQKWIDLTGTVGGKEYGMAVLNDGKYGFDVQDGVMRLTLLRSPAYAHHDPAVCDASSHFPFIDQGWQRVAVRLVPHGGDWRNTGLARQAWELNEPVFTHLESAHSGTLPGSLSFLSSSASNIVISVLKCAEKGGDLVIRLYETTGRHTPTRIELPSLNFSFETCVGPHEIKTVRLDVKQRHYREVNLLEETEGWFSRNKMSEGRL